MRKEIIIPPGDGESHPFFRPLPFTYRVSYLSSGNTLRNIEYTSPHEIILNLKSFRPNDTLTFIDWEDGKDVFTITIDQFALMISESTVTESPANLEMLYGRLLLTNKFSRAISDRGKLMTYDHHFRRFLLTLRAGIDSYFSHPQYYLKCRRPSILHLRAVVLSKLDALDADDIQFHVNIPSTLSNHQGLFVELVGMNLPRDRLRLYSYNPVPEDVQIPTDTSREIIRIINHLIN